MKEFENQVAVITGGNRGIGIGIAGGLASAGADICIWGRDETHNFAAVETLMKHGTRVSSFTCDVSDELQVVSGMNYTLDKCTHTVNKPAVKCTHTLIILFCKHHNMWIYR